MKHDDAEHFPYSLNHLLQLNAETLNFAERLHHALDLNRVSQNIKQRRDYLTNLFKITSQQACAWLNAKKRPSTKMMQQIAAVLKVNYDWLWRESGRPIESKHRDSHLYSLPIYYLGRHSKHKLLFDSFQGKRLAYPESVSSDSFAINLIDDQFAPLFPSNTTLVIDPKQTPDVADFILAYQSQRCRFACGHTVEHEQQKFIMTLDANDPEVLLPQDVIVGVISSAEIFFTPKQNF